jgi:hypothetical protein
VLNIPRVMAVRTDAAPPHLIHWLMAPTALGALLMALLSAVRRRAAEPSLPRMSDEWMRSQGAGEWRSWR